MKVINVHWPTNLHLKSGLFFSIILSINSLSFSQVATINVTNINAHVMDNTKLLFGITFDARTSLLGNPSYGQIGYYDSSGTIIPQVNAIFSDFPFTTIRYPGNAISVGFEWKKSIGQRPRPNQDLLGSVGSPQPVNFGFDEFIALCFNKGLSGNDIQIMVPIYDESTSGLTPTQLLAAVPNVISNNADWVEYCNAPNNGSNPGGGTDWAAVRASNGHPDPYNIKIWNIGNEPWASGEYGPTSTGCNDFLTDITPIVNAMLTIDPTIKITMPTTGNGAGTWSNTLINSTLAQQGKIYSLSQHFFGDEDLSTSFQGVNAANTFYNSLINAAALKGIKVFAGDYAHSIPTPNPTSAQQDLAMQWQGANFEADFLLMLSQKSTIERANFWAYGNAYAVWHPIRINAGIYTLMPGAAIYKILKPVFLDHSVQVTTTSPAASDGIGNSVRSNVFVSNDLNNVNIVAVNRDKSNTVPLQVSGLGGYNVSNARILSATTLNAENIIETAASTDVSGNYIMPPMSILIVEYSSTALSINDLNLSSEEINCKIELSWQNSAEENIKEYIIEHSSNGIDFKARQLVLNTNDDQPQKYYIYSDEDVKTGTNYYRLKIVDQNFSFSYSPIISQISNCILENISKLIVYPNPANGILSFSKSLQNIEIFNLYGQKVLTHKGPSSFISTSGLTAGTYWLRSEGNTSKFIIR